MIFENEEIFRLIVALVIGGVMGAEREYRSKSAGFRTIALICLGSALFTILSIKIGAPNSTDRIASNIVTGIGFLGAGVIFRETHRVTGLTTAAIIWAAAALGMGIGGGYYELSLVAGTAILSILFLFRFVEDFIDGLSQVRHYRIVCRFEQDTLHRYEELFKTHHLKAFERRQSRVGGEIIGHWEVYGNEKNHDAFIQRLLADSTVKEFDF